MEKRESRLIDHIHIRVSDLEASQRFYQAVLNALGIEYISDETHFSAAELWIDQGESQSSVHIAFKAKGRDMVDRWYEAGLEAGGYDNGLPGLRKHHPGYYAAFLLDPDGNNIEAVFHGDAD